MHFTANSFYFLHANFFMAAKQWDIFLDNA